MSVTLTPTRPASRCGTCGFRKASPRARCDHSRLVRVDGEVVGRISYRPQSWQVEDGVQYAAWKVEDFDAGKWWRTDSYEDALFDLTDTDFR